jgi:hypothetical protein
MRNNDRIQPKLDCFEQEGGSVNELQIFAVFMLLLTHMAHPACCQSTNDNVTAKLDALVEKDKARLINSTRELVMIKSVNVEPQTGAPFGQGTAKALDKALQIAGDCACHIIYIL